MCNNIIHLIITVIIIDCSTESLSYDLEYFDDVASIKENSVESKDNNKLIYLILLLNDIV